MTRAAVLIPMLLAACAPVPPPPVCAQREVLQLLAERLGHAGQGQFIEPDSVNERPGERPGLAYCAVRVQTATYDISRFGPAPVITIGIVQYAVEMRTNGAFLLPDQTPSRIGVARRSM